MDVADAIHHIATVVASKPITSQLAGEISEIGYGRSLLESSLTYRKTWENHTSFV